MMICLGKFDPIELKISLDNKFIIPYNILKKQWILRCLTIVDIQVASDFLRNLLLSFVDFSNGFFRQFNSSGSFLTSAELFWKVWGKTFFLEWRHWRRCFLFHYSFSFWWMVLARFLLVNFSSIILRMCICTQCGQIQAILSLVTHT